METIIGSLTLGLVCYLGIIVGSVLSFIAPEEISDWRKTYEILAKIIFLTLSIITLNFLIKNTIIRILIYAVLVLILNLEIKLILRVIMFASPIILTLNMAIDKLEVVKEINIILIFLNLIFFGLLESYFLIPKVFDKRRKYLKKSEILLITKKTIVFYALINLVGLVLNALMISVFK
ncbi:MAG: hypothetical protein QXU20_01520 [Candidatus Woesearchaeota archaeon]